MPLQPSLGLSQRQQLTLTPQIRQALHLLQCSSQELALEVEQALSTNPLLELADAAADAPEPEAPESSDAPDVAAWPQAPLRARTVTDDIPEAADTPSLSDYLLQQLHTTRASDRDRLLVGVLMGELDERGYLEFDPALLSAELPDGVEVSAAEWRVALKLLQSFDPVGIGARDLPECLRIQLQARTCEWPLPIVALASKLTDHLEDLAAARWGRLCGLLGCERDALEAARTVLRSLEPRPLRGWGGEPVRYVVPDVQAEPTRGGGWRVVLNPAAERPLRLSPDLVATLDGPGVAQGLRDQLHEARNLMHNLDQRRQTILRVAQSIVQHQPAFLERGMDALQPLTQLIVAQELGLHESTVSRAVRQKYLQTPLGVFELRRLFGTAVAGSDGPATSANAVQALMHDLLAGEPADKPLSDMQLTRLLAERSVVVARRTVAKYREAMGVLPASLRKR